MPVRFCAATFARSSSSLPITLRCSRCKCTYYKTREKQRQHWHIHKRHCSASDPEALAAMSIGECLRMLQSMMMNLGSMSGNTVPLLRRIRELLQQTADDDAGIALHDMTRCFMSGEHAAEYYSHLW